MLRGVSSAVSLRSLRAAARTRPQAGVVRSGAAWAVPGATRLGAESGRDALSADSGTGPPRFLLPGRAGKSGAAGSDAGRPGQRASV